MIVFKTLTREDLNTIVDYELRNVRDRLGQHGLALELSAEAKEFLIDKGYNPDFGARPLRRAIEHHVEDPISEEILRGGYKGKAKIVVGVREAAGEEEEGHLYFEGVGEPPAEQPEAGEELEEVHEGT